MSVTKCPGRMRSLKLNFSATVLTFGLKAKIFENLRLCQATFWGELRTRATFDRCELGQSTPIPNAIVAKTTWLLTLLVSKLFHNTFLFMFWVLCIMLCK